MSEPTVHPVTTRIYNALEEFRRVADQPLGYPLLSWLSLLGDQLGDMSDLLDRIDFRPLDEGGPAGDTSDLADPSTADAAWLPWLAQFVAVNPAGLSEATLRAAIATASSGYRVCTKAAIAAAAQSVLTGSKYVAVYDHSTSSPGNGGQWDVMIVTRPTETSSTADVINAVINAGAKPAGVQLHVVLYGASWTQVATTYPTWVSRNALTWTQMQEAGL